MKTFALKSVLFLLPVLIIAGAFEYALTGVPNSYNKKRKFFESQLDSIEVLVLGNSRSLYSINPAYFSAKGYNLSHVSQSFYYMKEIGARYIPRMPRLKCVIIECTPGSFYTNLTRSIERWRTFYYLHYWDIDNRELQWYEVNRYSKFFLYEPKRSFYYATKLFDVDLARGMHPNGWEFMDTTNTKLWINDSTARVRAAFNDSNADPASVAENRKNLESLISVIRARKLDCVLISSPVYATYAKYMNRDKIQTGIKIAEELSSKYGCEYYNYLTDPRFELNDFSDNDHFNFIGARKYSRIINEEIIRNILLKDN